MKIFDQDWKKLRAPKIFQKVNLGPGPLQLLRKSSSCSCTMFVC